MHSRLTLAAALGALALGGALAPPAHSAELPIPQLGGGHQVAVESMQAVRFRGVERQALDFSCGSAAVATLLNYHYQHKTDEATVFAGMFAASDQERVRQEGFSMLDMQSYLRSIGYRADGFNLETERLAMLGVPAIVLIDTGGYLHFVVIKGLRDGEVLVGDPALGLRAYTMSAFEEIRRGPLFIVRDRPDLAQRLFNQETEWAARTRPPYNEALKSQSVAQFLVDLPRPGTW